MYWILMLLIFFLCFYFVCLQTAAEYERRRENFFNELEVVFADVVCNFLYRCFSEHFKFSLIVLHNFLGVLQNYH